MLVRVDESKIEIQEFLSDISISHDVESSTIEEEKEEKEKEDEEEEEDKIEILFIINIVQ